MKLVSIITVIIMALQSLMINAYAQNSSQFSDLGSESECVEAVGRLHELGIVNGYDDGEYKPQRKVTRAEFSKIVVGMMDKHTEAKSTAPTSAFDDVNDVKWCIPYVNYLTGNGIIKGYADASFKPNNVITYAEAITILCRILGYKEEDIGYSWPANYINQAEALELDKGMNYSANDAVTRSSMAIICDRALFTNISGSANTTLLESFGYTILEDCFIAATKNEESSLNADQIRTSSGVYDVENVDILSKLQYIGTLVLNPDEEAIMFIESDLEKLDIMVTELKNSNTVEYRANNSQKGTYTFKSNFVMYHDNNKTTYQAVGQQIKMGTTMTFFGESYGDWSFAVINNIDENEVVPVRATKNYSENDTYLEGEQINFDGLTVYRNNKTVSVSDIEINDVVYYNKVTNVMDVYTKKVTGIYNEALPTKTYVTSVNVGGNTYQINENVDTSKLDATNGSFQIGDRVTLLLGENNEVCFAVELSDISTFEYGVVLDTYKEISANGDNEGSSQIMASLFMPDGNTYEYRTDKNYDTYIGDLVKLSYNNGVVSMTQTKSSNSYGEVDVSKRTIGTKTALRDIVIFHRISEEDSGKVEVEILDFDTLDASEITNAQLITSVSANSFGDIAVMYVCNMASGYNYGMLRKIEEMGGESTATTYTIYADGIKKDYSCDMRYSINLGPVRFKLSNGKIISMKALSAIASSKDIDAIEGGRIMLDGNIYKMSDNVQIIKLDGMTNCENISMNELKNTKISKITIYTEDYGKYSNSIVRLITVGI